MHKIAFLCHPVCARIGDNVSGLFDSFNAKKLVAEFHRENASSTRNPLGGLRGNIRDSSSAG